MPAKVCAPAKAFMSASMSSEEVSRLYPVILQAEVLRTQIKLEQQWVESLQRR